MRVWIGYGAKKCIYNWVNLKEEGDLRLVIARGTERRNGEIECWCWEVSNWKAARRVLKEKEKAWTNCGQNCWTKPVTEGRNRDKRDGVSWKRSAQCISEDARYYQVYLFLCSVLLLYIILSNRNTLEVYFLMLLYLGSIKR